VELFGLLVVSFAHFLVLIGVAGPNVPRSRVIVPPATEALRMFFVVERHVIVSHLIQLTAGNLRLLGWRR